MYERCSRGEEEIAISRCRFGEDRCNAERPNPISRLLGVHMEELIVARTLSATAEKFFACEKRMLAYWKVLGSAV